MKVVILLLILILEFSWFFCNYHDIDSELIGYNNFFINELQIYCNPDQYFYPRKTVIKIANSSAKEVGICRMGLLRFEIVFNKQYWNDLDEDTRFSTAMHEFLHCYMKYGKHSKDPDHFMYFMENNLKKEIVVKQLREMLKEECGN